MQLHGNARTTPYIRREMVRRVRERVEPVTETAAALGVSARTVYKWLDRYERGCSTDADMISANGSAL